MAQWGKECGCGERRIPKDWPHCGECAEARTRVEIAQAQEPGFRQDRTTRHRLVTALARIRQGSKQPDSPVDRAIEQATILHTKAERRRKLAERLPEALVDWGNQE